MQEGEVSFSHFTPDVFFMLQLIDKTICNVLKTAPWTFNPDLFLKCLKTLREQVIGPWLY